MLGPSWISLFRRIPTRLHDAMALTLSTGSEIVVQDILRLEPDFAILRGRVAGSTDAGRVVVLPYDQIVNLAFTKRMTEPEVQGVFGQPLSVAAPAPAVVAAGSATAPAETVAPQPPSAAEAVAPAPVFAQSASEETAGADDGPEVADELAMAEPEEEEDTSAPGSVTLTTVLKTAPRPPAPPGEKPKAVSKSILLARLRQRLSEQKSLP